jgi:hypothetical protein
MSNQRSVKTYRVVGIQSNGRRAYIDGQLSKFKADAVRNSLLTKFPEVLIEEERRSGRGPSQIGDALPYPD